MRNVRTGLIDSHTPKSALKKKSVDGRNMHLVVRFASCLQHNAANKISIPTSSVRMGGRSTMVMIHTGKVLISGMESPLISRYVQPRPNVSDLLNL
jgi:hypothetical protein